MGISEFQFGAMMVMGLLTASLVTIPPLKSGTGPVYRRARWLLAIGTLLLTVQFYLQYTTGYRTNGEIAKSVFINLLFFLPASWFFNLSILYLLHNGRLGKWEWLTGPICYIILLITLFPSLSAQNDWISIKNAELLATIIYGLTLLIYNIQEYLGLRNTKKALDNYYDQSKKDILDWLGISVTLLALLALSTPICVYIENQVILVILSLLILVFIYYYVINFICFGVSEHAHMIYVANEEDDKEETGLPETKTNEKSNNQRVEEAITKWMKERGHLKMGITIQDAVEEMQIPRYLLVQWIKSTKYEVFSRWITHLRVEEAKRLLTAHPDYSNEAIAHECGFSSRSYFQKVFREQTGMTPLEFQNQEK